LESLGQYLKRERELRDISLKTVEETTKVPIKFLMALERNDYDVLPGRAFIIGFLRSYAKAVSIDSDEVVNRYLDYSSAKKEEITSIERKIEEKESKKKLNVNLILGIFVGFSLLVILGVAFYFSYK